VAANAFDLTVAQIQRVLFFYYSDTKQNGGSCVFADDLSLAAVPDYFGVRHDNYLDLVFCDIYFTIYFTF